jgi:hypothetical protein
LTGFQNAGVEFLETKEEKVSVHGVDSVDRGFRLVIAVCYFCLSAPLSLEVLLESRYPSCEFSAGLFLF